MQKWGVDCLVARHPVVAACWVVRSLVRWFGDCDWDSHYIIGRLWAKYGNPSDAMRGASEMEDSPSLASSSGSWTIVQRNSLGWWRRDWE